MKESKNIGEWTFHDSDLVASPEILLEQKRNDPLVADLLVDIGVDGDQRGMPDVSLLSYRLDLLLSEDTMKQRHKRKLTRELAGSGIGREALADANALRSCRESIFGRKVRCATCRPFPPEQVVLVDLSFLPDDFFSPSTQPEMVRHYERMVNNPKSEVGSFREFMHWGRAKNFGCRFQFGGEERNTDAFVGVLNHFLIKYGGKDQEAKDRNSAILLRDEWSLGWLSTVLERMQDPHVDYGHKRLSEYKTMSGKRSLNKAGQPLLPWSFDMPLTQGGLRLAFYGIDDPQNPSALLETPVEMYVPPKHVMLWRGDCVHAGGLLDGLGKSGFRMHGCLPLSPAHRGCGHDSVARIEWHGLETAHNGGERKRYSHRLKKLDGSSFAEDDIVRYAEDVVEKFGVERTKLWKLQEGEWSKKRARHT